ncbi:MAG: S8/S53 family peptidase [Boseongicola sp.]|nr:S8/S53 family peptidase [Boseongicola sp.]
MSAAFVTCASAQDNYLKVQLEGPMAPELRLALSNILDPSTDHNALISAFQQAVPAASLVAEGTFPESEVDQFGLLIRPSSVDIEQSVTASALKLPRGAPGIDNFLFSTERGDPIQDSDPAFIFAERDSDVFRAYAGFAQYPAIVAEGSELIKGYAAPISQQQILAMDRFGVSDTPGSLTPIVLDAVAVQSLALLDRDIEELQLTVRSFKLPDLESLPQAKWEALYDAFEEAGAPRPSISVSPSEVEIDTTPGKIEQTGADGNCQAGGADWPYNVSEISEVLNRNFGVISSLGIQHLTRTEVMIVDSGLPTTLAADPVVSPFLRINLAAALSGGLHVRSTSLTPQCTYRDWPPHAHTHGYVVRSGRIGSCVNVADAAQIAPPRPTHGATNYVWDHGGFVGVLAAGGPSLMSSIDWLNSIVGISFARVMRSDDDTLRADPTDISEAIEFARKRRVPILNISLRISESVQQTVFPKLVEYWTGGGLTIAAAGNTGGPLSPSSNVFPASAVASPKDSLIVVGGIERAANGQISVWPQSSRSSTIIDVAAPSVAIRSLDGEARPGCYLGTSVAAPQVSFVAAALRSFGLERPAAIKRRILATADKVDNLKVDVRDGRVLNAARALDVFTDLIWPRGSNDPMRVEILGDPHANGFPFIHICSEGADYDGWIDLARLHAFERREDGQATIWHDANEPSGISQLNTSCPVLNSATFMIRVGDAEEEISVGDIDRIVPSRFRAVFDLNDQSQ